MSKNRKKDFLATSASEYFTSAKPCLEKQLFFSLRHHICKMFKTTLCLFCLQEEINKKKWIVPMQSFKRKKTGDLLSRVGENFFLQKRQKHFAPFPRTNPREQ
jgi:hypothetical protein